jgi:hypothetical protein
VGDIIPNLGCTQTRESKFYRTLELYWHTKTMVAQGMLPKDQDYQYLNNLEALEDQNILLITMVSWLMLNTMVVLSRLLRMVVCKWVFSGCGTQGQLILAYFSGAPLPWLK